MIPALLFILVLLVIISILRKPKEDYHSNWAQLLSGFKFSTKEFYKLVKEEMQSHEIKEISFEEVSLKIGSVFSSERLYLRVRWKEYYYDLCFAPFGDGCFVSWWLIFETSPEEEFLTKIPFIGEWIRRVFFRKTYYKIDTASMFMTYAHHSVLAVIDEITKSTGIRLTEAERKPILNDIFHR
ncbi:MAG: hypothetical protein C0397_09855 [Odoribacter sp.]|nr:hypothetical protein [Odoribacter sp.]